MTCRDYKDISDYFYLLPALQSFKLPCEGKLWTCLYIWLLLLVCSSVAAGKTHLTCQSWAGPGPGTWNPGPGTWNQDAWTSRMAGLAWLLVQGKSTTCFYSFLPPSVIFAASCQATSTLSTIFSLHNMTLSSELVSIPLEGANRSLAHGTGSST